MLLNAVSRTSVDLLKTVTSATNVVTHLFGAMDTGAQALNLHANDYLQSSAEDIAQQSRLRKADRSVAFNLRIAELVTQTDELATRLAADQDYALRYNALRDAVLS